MVRNRSDDKEAKMRFTTTVILAVGLLAAVAAGADGASPRELAEQAFAETDVDRDGRVNREEYYRRMADMYYQADRDRDGQLNRTELAEIQEEMVFDPADTNGDGTLTMPEYIDQRFETFHEVDLDSDGLLTRDEVIESYEEAYR
jgi:Ca2+-binding EF-hand superfamily protein